MSAPASSPEAPPAAPLASRYVFDGIDFFPYSGPGPKSRFTTSTGPVTVAKLGEPVVVADTTFSLAVSFSAGSALDLDFTVYVPDLPSLLTLCDCLAPLFAVTRGNEVASALRAGLLRR